MFDGNILLYICLFVLCVFLYVACVTLLVNVDNSARLAKTNAKLNIKFPYSRNIVVTLRIH